MIAVPKKLPKKKIAKAVDQIHSILKKEFGDDMLVHAFTINLILNAIKDQEAIENIMLPTTDMKKDVFADDKKINRCRKIVEGMKKSSVNLLLFRDEYDVWMQYYMGLFLKKDTIIFALEEEKEQVMPRIQVGGLVKDIVFFKDFKSKKSQDKIGKALKKYADGL